MKLSWKPKYEIASICDEIEKCRTGDPGTASFSCSGWYEDYRSLLDAAIQFPSGVSSGVRERIINAAFGKTASKGTLTPARLLASVGKEFSEWQSKPNEKYVLLTQLSIVHEQTKRVFRVRTETISLLRDKPKELVQERIKFHWPSGFRGINIPTNYCWVTVATRGRDYLDAANKALESLNYLVGSWNFALNLRTLSECSSPLPKSVNRIQLGPVQTLHKLSKPQEEDYAPFWYRPEYIEAPKAAKFSQAEWEMLEQERSWLSRALKRHPYGASVREALIRYAEALDQHDRSTAFVKLWSVLEYLTDTIGGSYAELVRRAAFLYSEHDLHRQILEMLRDQRNDAIHHGTNPDSDQYTIYQLKRYVEQALLFHAANHFRFTSLQDAAKFLSLSHEPHLLKKQIALCEKAIKYRKE